MNPGACPAVYSPGEDSDETLELDDPDMIAALETVRGAVRRSTPRPGRLRGTLLGGSTLAILGIVAFFLPDALVRHTASVLPICHPRADRRGGVGRYFPPDRRALFYPLG